MLWLHALLLISHAMGEQLPLSGAALFEMRMVAGDYWGLPAEEAALRLGAGRAPRKRGVSRKWFLAAGLGKLWGKDPGKFSRTALSGSSWLLSLDGKTFGYMVKLPSSDQAFYDAQARKRFSRYDIIHLEVPPPPGMPDPAYFIHCVRWINPETKLVLLTAAPKIREFVQTDPETGLVMRTEILYKKNDPGVPLYLVFWDGKRL